MREPKEKDIKEAKEYIIKMLDAERSMISALRKLMSYAAERIVLICYSYNLNPSRLMSDDLPFKAQTEIDNVIKWLEDSIDDYFRTIATACNDADDDIIIPWIYRRQHGKTFSERLKDYLNKFRFEILFLTAAGIAIGLGSIPLIKSIISNLKKPYSNKELKEGFQSVPPSYGVGRSNSMFTSIGALASNGIGQGWLKNKYAVDSKRGCVGWWVERGSTVPCDICDSMTGFHYNDSSLPMYHLSCCCIAVPIFPKYNYK